MKDANGQSLAYVYGRETRTDADIAHVLTMDEARRIASNIASCRPFYQSNLTKNEKPACALRAQCPLSKREAPATGGTPGLRVPFGGNL